MLMCAYKQKGVLWDFNQDTTLLQDYQHPLTRYIPDLRDDSLNESITEKGLNGNTRKAKSCVTNHEVVESLRELVLDLIDIRVSVEGKAAEKIEEKYDKFQRMLLDIETKLDLGKPYKAESRKNSTIYSCPEVRTGPKFNRKFERINCSKVPLHESVTVIIDNVNLTRRQTVKLLKEIRKFDNKLEVLTMESNDENYARSTMINKVMDEIVTPFVYLARDLYTWNSHADLERLVDFISVNEDVVAVGNALVNSRNGHWSHGCYQARLKNYEFAYKRGYHESKGSCIKCDILEGPFMTKLEYLRDLPFKEGLVNGYYEDWYLKINNLNGGDKHEKYIRKTFINKDVKQRKKVTSIIGKSVYSCPDVMSTVSKSVDFTLISKYVADEWDIEKIVDPNDRVEWLDCKWKNDDATPGCWVGRGMAVPPCCLETLAEGIKFVLRTCELNKISCELTEGTLLGAVKLQKLLPWEKDADILFLSSHFERLIALKDDFKNKGYSFLIKEWPRLGSNESKIGGSILVIADGWNIEMYGSQSLDSHQKILHGEKPTKIDFAGQMANVPDNPGKVSRNRYGIEIYKHSEHWMSKRMNSGYDEYEPGEFNDCVRPGHHGCLDQYEADGSLQFQESGTF
eukprot:gene12884-3635_t